ncbi:hypothetical protein L207DRAFT_517161 [Hyaloscypha variabilis F]|uniref:Ubiquitin-like domain-containing protein n=1 Tax=Hyaloscypha variabilis (strain UAMH 11265 / GT02V1 / F) TaxID=1149755 RepID=A0A2J6R970_HYAVF|nr:hypothetical protein L207DRAFT_517161 [Hyaloscypha variabilis F]
MTLDEDSTLQWEPQAGSAELAIALTYHFPLEKGVEKKMQAATRQFFKQKAITLIVTAKSTEDVTQSEIDAPPKTILQSTDQNSEKADFSQPGGHREQLDGAGLPESNAASVDCSVLEHLSVMPSQASTANALKFVNWDPKKQKQGTKRPYQEEEKAKVTENRGFVCDRHRRQKKKCDPGKCSMNGQNPGQANDFRLRIPTPEALFCPPPKGTSNWVSNSEGPTGGELPTLMVPTQATASTLHNDSSASSMVIPLKATQSRPEAYSRTSTDHNFRSWTAKTMGEMGAASGAKGAEVIGSYSGIVGPNHPERGFHQNCEDGLDPSWFDSGLFGVDSYLFGGSMLSPNMNAGPGNSAMATCYTPPKAAWNSERAGMKMQDLNSSIQDPFSFQADNSNVAGSRDQTGNLNGSWDGPSSSSDKSLRNGERDCGEHMNVLSEHVNAPISLGSATKPPGSIQHSAADSPSGLTRRICCTYFRLNVTFVLEVKLTMRTYRFMSQVRDIMAERIGTYAASHLRFLYDGNRISPGDGETIADLYFLEDGGTIDLHPEQIGGGGPLFCLSEAKVLEIETGDATTLPEPRKIPPRTSQRCLRSSTVHLRDSNKSLTSSMDHDGHNSPVHGINRGPHLCTIAGCIRSRGSGYRYAGHLKTHLLQKHPNLSLDGKSVSKTSLESCELPLTTKQRCLRSYTAKLRSVSESVLCSVS